VDQWKLSSYPYDFTHSQTPMFCRPVVSSPNTCAGWSLYQAHLACQACHQGISLRLVQCGGRHQLLCQHNPVQSLQLHTLQPARSGVSQAAAQLETVPSVTHHTPDACKLSCTYSPSLREESNAVAACKQASLQPLAVCHIKAAHLFHAGDRLGVVRMLVKSREASARYVGSGTSPTAIYCPI
jgi:hypothetical protein